MKKLAKIVSVAIFLLPAEISAQDFDAGLAAMKSGDFETALSEWVPLAEQGHGLAQHNIATIYLRSEGVEQDIDKSTYWFRAAAEQGLSESQYNLGQIFLHGGPIEATEAVHWFRAAAKQGHSFAQHNLGGMYYFGRGVAQSDMLARMWYEIAFINGDDKGATSMENVGRRMTPEDINAARNHVWTCMESNYENCGD